MRRQAKCMIQNVYKIVPYIECFGEEKTDNSYVGSFLDTEGSLGIYGKKTKVALIRLSNTYKQVLEDIQWFLGYGRIFPQSKSKNNPNFNHKTVWLLAVEDRKHQIMFLESVLPFLIIKKEKALNMLDWLKNHPLYQRQNIEERRKQGELFKCGKCGKLFPKEKFWKNKHGRYGISAYCVDCEREYEKKRYYSGKDKNRRCKHIAS